MYGCAPNQETMYGKFFHHQTFPPREQRFVFIYGAIRVAKIMVRDHKDSRLQITGLIDWEKSGFYPEDLECTRALNKLSPIGKEDPLGDWYQFLPGCIVPRDHLVSWHADLV